MFGKKPIFSSEEVRQFCDLLYEKFRGGVRSHWAVIYIGITFIGVTWASVGIPNINNSEISPETLGIYVIGFLMTVIVDSLFAAMKKSGENPLEGAVAAFFLLLGLVLVVWASYLSVKNVVGHEGAWKFWATPQLVFILISSIVMSLVLSGIDPKLPKIGPLDKPPGAVSN